MENESLEIHDEDRSSEGGAPGWIVWAVILASVTTIVVAALIIGVLM